MLLPRSSRRRDRASREEYNDLLAFYKGADFDHDPINARFTWFPPRRTQLGDSSQVSRF